MPIINKVSDITTEIICGNCQIRISDWRNRRDALGITRNHIRVSIQLTRSRFRYASKLKQNDRYVDRFRDAKSHEHLEFRVHNKHQYLTMLQEFMFIELISDKEAKSFCAVIYDISDYTKQIECHYDNSNCLVFWGEKNRKSILQYNTRTTFIEFHIKVDCVQLMPDLKNICQKNVKTIHINPKDATIIINDLSQQFYLRNKTIPAYKLLETILSILANNDLLSNDESDDLSEYLTDYIDHSSDKKMSKSKLSL